MSSLKILRINSELEKTLSNIILTETNDEFLKTPSVLNELERVKTIDNIMRGDFQNKKMGYLFREGGRNLILESMDANDIYNSSKEDLLRAGIIDEKAYFALQDKSHGVYK